MSEPGHITVRYFAAARAAAAMESEQLVVVADTTVADLVDRLRGRSTALAQVLPRCSYLYDGVAVRDHNAPVQAGTTFDVLPPFAGG